ncbi:MAG TPA: ABC transporter ATP-binding protein, partial [Casimicrobiaceae bacterium]|nr:ABC transporter ATP-binding protein [Casimicrobiaceae bacterium]
MSATAQSRGARGPGGGLRAAPPGGKPAVASSFLDVRDVRHHYGATKAVAGVSFPLGPGWIFAVIGPHASG